MSIFAICLKSHSSQIFRLEQMFYSQNHLLKKIVFGVFLFRVLLLILPKTEYLQVKDIGSSDTSKIFGMAYDTGSKGAGPNKGGKDGQRWGCQKQTHLCMVFMAVALALKSGSPWLQQQEPLL